MSLIYDVREIIRNKKYDINEEKIQKIADSVQSLIDEETQNGKHRVRLHDIVMVVNDISWYIEIISGTNYAIS